MRRTLPVSSRTQTDPKPIEIRTGSPPTRNLPVMRLLRGSARSIAFAFRSAIQSEPNPRPKPIGVDTPRILPLGLFVAASIRVTTLAQCPPATQAASVDAAIKVQGCP